MRLILAFVLIVCQNILIAQDADYFQQEVNYTIDVSLDDQNHVLRGFESFEYINNSAQTLDSIYIHIWPNAYRNRKTALAKQLIKMGNDVMYFASEEELGYIDSLNFKINNEPVEFRIDEEFIDIGVLKLPSGLEPGESCVVTTPFKVKLPSGNISRLGHIGESYQITQWYPKPAVFDKEGWHQMPYLTQGEFFSEYGSFDVEITLPKNYVVGATGDLQTQSEIDWLNQKALEDSAWISKRVKANDWKEFDDMHYPSSVSEMKTLRFKQSMVHDFAWFADKRYRVLKGKVTLPHSSKTSTVWTMFTPRASELWSKSIEYMHDAIYSYSLWNGDYPYKQATAVDGTISAGGGMEYPNVTVIGSAGSAVGLETVITHEVGHNWFYGILGSNERENAWLDEGLNSYNEQRYLSTKYPNKWLFVNEPRKIFKYAGLNEYGVEDSQFLIYLISARSNMDQPLNVHSAAFSSLNYGAMVYAKSAIFMNYMRYYLGDQEMDASMQKYFEENKFKHPTEQDLQKAFENVSKPTSWFFNEVVHTSGELDYKIKKAKVEEEATVIKIKNKGKINGPVRIDMFNNDSLVHSQWIDGFRTDTTFVVSKNSSVVRIDMNREMPEVNRTNNTSRTRGVFKKVEPIQLKLIGSLENPKKSQIFWVPLIGWNNPSGFMPGLMFYNSIIPTKKFSYVIAPMLSLYSKTPTGALNLNYKFSQSEGMLESIDIGLRGKSYLSITGQNPDSNLQYFRTEPYLKFYIRPNDYSSLWRHELELSSVITSTLASSESGIRNLSRPNYFNRLNFRSNYSHPVFRSSFVLGIEQSDEFVKSQFEVRNRTSITERLHIDSRAFAGWFFDSRTDNPAYNWRMDGQGITNGSDYAYDAELLARNNSGLFARQLTETQGGFKVPTAVAQSNQYLLSSNFKLGYGKFPIGLFADVGFSSNRTVADAGAYISLAGGLLECYFPLLYSRNIQVALDANGQEFEDIIRFKLDLDQMNIFERAKRISF